MLPPSVAFGFGISDYFTAEQEPLWWASLVHRPAGRRAVLVENAAGQEALQAPTRPAPRDATPRSDGLKIGD